MEGLGLLVTLKALVAETERRDNMSDMGVSSDDDVMIAARAAIADYERLLERGVIGC